MGSESDQLVRDVLDGVLVEPEFLAQPPIADPLLRHNRPATRATVFENVMMAYPLRNRRQAKPLPLKSVTSLRS